MCGIVGFIGKKQATEPVLDGLTTLEYRGYDSAGISLIKDDVLLTVKQVGEVNNLRKSLAKQTGLAKAHIAIGHTRWATHGSPTQLNAHPHTNTDQTISVVHNGIIENYRELRDKLTKQGYGFVSETDTEIIPMLIDYNLKSTNNFRQAFEKTIQELEGAYAIGAIYALQPDRIFVAKLSSPLIIGVGKHEHYIASDANAILQHTKRVVYLDDYDVAEVTATKISTHNLKQATDILRKAESLDFESQQSHKGNFKHFMLKEIFEAPETIRAASQGRIKPETNTIKLGGLESVEQQLRYIDRIVIVACGTSFYAGLIGEYLIEELASIPVEVQLASEFKYRHEPFSRGTVVIAISQSGETADTIAALKKVEAYGVLRLGIVNATGSTIARMTDAGVYCHAGPEQSVASTKAFISQVIVLAEVALFLSKQPSKTWKQVLQAITDLPELAEQVLASAPEIEKVAKKYSKTKNFLYMGRGYSYPCALEGALKLKEVSYIHAEGYAAGEMKHGPLAMIDRDFPTFALASQNQLRDKTYSNIEEIRARDGKVVAIATRGDRKIKKLANDVMYVPACIEQLQPVLDAIVLQLFSYYIAVEKGLNVDRPRNLAKSVTVE